MSMGRTKTKTKEKYQATSTDSVTTMWCLYQFPYWKRRYEARRNVVTRSTPSCQLDMMVGGLSFVPTLFGLQEFGAAVGAQVEVDLLRFLVLFGSKNVMR